MTEIKRCPWANDPYSIEYHDKEWGKINLDENHLFELLILEGFQAGLNWATILRKREAFKRAFDHFDPEKVALYEEEKINELMQNEEIIRNSLKIKAAITNAKAFLKTQEEFGSFAKYIWAFTDQQQIVNNWQSWEEVPAKTELSEKISKDLKKRGFKFVGPVIVYSYLGAIGIINDHLIDCPFR
ncbi:MAG: DNA-3-methyladenine glycosylase I [Firmicutes bacterium]|nr:DNA-3-methyladenine glycosylase I [Bacillota bacterium]